MQIQENISLKPYNTFGIDAKARYFATFQEIDELEDFLTNDADAPVKIPTSAIADPRDSRLTTNDSRLTTHDSRLPTLPLGGGSNILFTKDYDGLVLKNEIKGIKVLHEEPEYVYVKVGAGENWHSFVMHCISLNWAGVENLSLIPGCVGAAPIQNIGAYGVELRSVFLSLEAFHLKEKKRVTFTETDCEFGYRDSVFKNKFKDQFVILNVTFRLKKHPVFHTSYGDIEKELERMGVKELSIKAISDAVINIRRSKLPDPKVIGNAGSFFKNPEITNNQFSIINNQYPGVVGHPTPYGNVKLSAAWLIEHCGPEEGISWKGYRKGDAGCHAQQALVLVNHGHASGAEILELSEAIAQSIKIKFGITITREVNIA